MDPFVATLSIPGREELGQVSMSVTVVPAPSWQGLTVGARDADEAGDDHEKGGAGFRGGEVGTGCSKKSPESTFALPRDAWSTPVTPPVFSTMTVIGFWEPGKGVCPLGALHLITTGRGFAARVVAEAGNDASCDDKLASDACDDTLSEDPAAGSEKQPVVSGIAQLHSELVASRKTAVVSIGGGQREIHLCAVPIDAPPGDLERDASPAETQSALRDLAGRGARTGTATQVTFLAFETKAMAPFHYAAVLCNKQLPVIFDLDETLLQAFTVASLDRRGEAIRKAHEESFSVANAAHAQTTNVETVVTATDQPTDAAGKTVVGAVGGAKAVTERDTREMRLRREEDMSRLKKDRVMLLQYVAENCVVDAKGMRHVAKQESATTAPGEVTFRPVIRLPSPHLRGGQVIFTRIDPANKGTSMIIHVRPGWDEMYVYLAGLDRLPPNAHASTHRPTPRCAAFVCTMSEPTYAQEMWRLLDPRGLLIPGKDLHHRVVSVKQTSELKTIDKAVGGSLGAELCVVLDDRTSVWEESAKPHILAVAPFMPYATDTGPGLAGEAPGEAGVLGAARRMLDKTRMDLFMAYEKFAKFHAAFPNARFEPPMTSLVEVGGTPGLKESADADGAEHEKDDSVSADTDKTSGNAPTSKRPQPPDAGNTLPGLMNAHAVEAAKAVAQMGGAARSAAGAGSRLNAMLGGIAAPRGAFKTLGAQSLHKGVVSTKETVAGVPPGGKHEHETEEKSDDGGREAAKAHAAAQMRIAAEESLARRELLKLEREAKQAEDLVNASDVSMEERELESDEERDRLQDIRAEAALGESSDSDDEPDDVTQQRAARVDALDDGKETLETLVPQKPKKRNECNTCGSQGLEPTDHFRYCTKCPYHPGYKGKYPRKISDVAQKEDEKEEDAEEAKDVLSSEDEKAGDVATALRSKERSQRAKKEILEVSSSDSGSEGVEKRDSQGSDSDSDEGKEEEGEEDEKEKGGMASEKDTPEEDAPSGDEDGGEQSSGRGKRKRATDPEKPWLPDPEETAESEIPKSSPSKPAMKRQKQGSQKSQREAMLKKLGGKKRR